MKNLLVGIAMLSALQSFGQRSCHTMENHERLVLENPGFVQSLQDIENFTTQYVANGNSEKAVVTIPVVFHIVYNTSTQNISDAQIQSQLTILNNDFRKLNADASSIPSTFTSVAADCEINFCLATVTPTGAATTGIVRKSTTVTSFSDNDAVKYSSQGGSDAWATDKYLNIWVCNLGGGLLGYAQFPGGPVATDGVVINYTAFGSTGTASSPYNKGRTATHEVGHWLNLRHIWGDATCGSDLVADTPTHTTDNGGCPTHPKSNSCGTTAEMFMNYMDYTNDACMYMFTAGQKSRMQALFATGGARASLKTSNGCSGSTPTTPSYCAANGTNVQYEWISNVKIGTINNTTGANGGYGNFTAQSTSLTKGSVYNLSMTPGFASSTYSEYFKVYIDYNADLDFADAGELVYTSAGTTAAVSTNITIPTTAVTGNTRMRVIMKDGTISGPCEVYTYGEVEDYTLNLTASTSMTCNQPASLTNSSITTTGATVSWGAVTGASNYTLQYKKSSTTTWTSVTVTGTSYALTGLTASTTYNWQVRTNCSAGSSAYTVGTNFTTSSTSTTCSDTYESNNTLSAAKTIPVNTTINALIGTNGDIDYFKFTNTSTAKNIKLTLTNLAGDYDLYLYNSSGTQIGLSENGSTTAESITFNNGAVGTYYVKVIGYNGAYSSTACYKLTANISGTTFKLDMSGEENIENTAVESNLTLFPNPSTDGRFACYLTNEFLGTVQMDIYDASGRIISSQSLDKMEQFMKTEVNLSQNQRGIYFVKMYNESFQQTVKVIYAE